MCGKDLAERTTELLQPGSPPHVRERQVVCVHGPLAFGITPACAGKTFLICSVIIQHQDHPRMCGKDKTTT